jgi:hypothetical protein
MKYGNVSLGQAEAFLNKIGGEHGLNQFLAGNLEVRAVKHVIDCNADPFVPRGMKLVHHKRNGIRPVPPERIQLYCTESQLTREGQRGTVLRAEIESYTGVLNANVLDHLLADTAAISQSWKAQVRPDYQTIVCFQGTEYEKDCGGPRKCVRTLSWSEFTGSWVSGIAWSDMLFHDFTPTAIM